MNFINNIIPESLIEAFGWMIVHSLWQGALIAILLSIVLLILNKKSSRARYLTAVGALLFFSAVSIRTFVEHYELSTKQFIQNDLAYEKIENINGAGNLITNNQITESSLFSEFSSYFYEHFPLIVTIYLLGVLFLTLKLMGGFLYAQRIKHYCTFEPEHKFKKLVGDFSRALNIKQKVKLVESTLINTPMTFGYFKPVILFPLGMLNGMSYQQVEAVIAHELAHIKRADYLVNLLQSFIEVIFFYHPAVWWISSIIKEERENICDDLALEVSNQPASLAKALVYIGEYENEKPSLAMSLIGNNNSLKRRVERMMGENRNKSFRRKIYSASLMLLIIISFTAIACSTANGEAYYQDKSKLVYEEDRDGDRRYIDTDAIYNEDERTYIFYKYYRGDKVKWEVTVDDNEVVSLYKDGDRVSQNEISNYDDMLLDEVDDIDWEMRELHENLADLKEDLKDLKVNLGEDFAKDMRKMAEEIRIEFNSDEFRRDMAQLKKDLRKIDFDFDFDFKWDSDEFRREMKGLKRELSNIKVDINLSGLDKELRELKDELRELDIDMSGLKKEMKILKNFLHDLKDELVADGVIDDQDDLNELKFEDDAMYVNDEKIAHDLYLKYKEMYYDYFGEYPDDNSFRMHN